MNEPLSTFGSVCGVGGRFNYGKDINKTQFQPFNALYLAETHDVALCEKYGISSDLSSQLSNQQLGLGPSSHNFVRIEGEVDSVIDIRKASSLKKFVNIIKHFKIDPNTNKLASDIGIKPLSILKVPSDLKKILHEINWKSSPTQVNLPSNSQIFGKLVQDAGIEGVLYNSTKGNGSCLALFPKNFEGSDSFVNTKDDLADTVLVTQLCKDTWDKLI